MKTAHTSRIVAAFAALLVTGAAWSQGDLTAAVDPSGFVNIMRGDTVIAMVELNAHGPNWQHAPQADATAQTTSLPGVPGRRVAGTLPIPGSEGAIRFVETVKPVPLGLQLEYDVGVTETVRLNGLQLSILLPVKQYAGKEFVVTRHGADPQISAFPEEQPTNFQLMNAQGARVEVDKGSDDAVRIQLRAATDLVVQDLRQWEHDIFEIRFPAIMEDGGREVTAEDRFHLDLTITFAEDVALAAE